MYHRDRRILPTLWECRKKFFGSKDFRYLTVPPDKKKFDIYLNFSNFWIFVNFFGMFLLIFWKNPEFSRELGIAGFFREKVVSKIFFPPKRILRHPERSPLKFKNVWAHIREDTGNFNLKCQKFCPTNEFFLAIFVFFWIICSRAKSALFWTPRRSKAIMRPENGCGKV